MKITFLIIVYSLYLVACSSSGRKVDPILSALEMFARREKLDDLPVSENLTKNEELIALEKTFIPQGPLLLEAREARKALPSVTKNLKVTDFSFEREDVKKGKKPSVREVKLSPKFNPVIKTHLWVKTEVYKAPETFRKALLGAFPRWEKYIISYRLKKGDTLQKVSLKHYQTTRRWLEIFVLNLDLLEIGDKVPVGKTLRLLSFD